ncbi:MAG: PilZ domain-containing protein [Halioglobus sp.]
MTEIRTEKRQFTRVKIDLPVDVHQGGSVWQQRLIDISLSSAATDQPDVWDAQYNEPFTLIIHLDDDNQLELHAYLQNVENKRLGFSVQHVDRTNIEPLRALLESRMDAATLERELRKLD